MMTTYKQYFKSLAAVLPVALTALAAASCSNDDAGSAPTGKTIAFTVTEDSQWQTRGAIAAQSRSLSLQAPGMAQPLYMTTTVADGMAQRTRTAAAEPSWPATRGVKVTTADQLTAFGVSAFLLKKTDVSVNTTPGYFYNLKATRNASDQYTVTQDYFWPAADECLHFYAYYPYDDPNVVISAANQVGPQTIAFTVDTDVSKQVDLMTAVAVDEATSTSVSQPTVTLPFRHELCAVSFRIADELFPATGGIVSVALKNVFGSGTMTIQQDAAGTWSFTGQNKTTFTATINKTGTGNLDNGRLISDNLTFLMIPQELTDDAVIEMVYQDNALNYTLTASLKDALLETDSEKPNYGHAFLEAGKTVTFALSSTMLSTLKIGTIEWPNAYSQTLAKNAYASGDKAGLYVLSADDKTFAYRNIPVTFDGSTWAINHNTDQGVVYSRPGYHYYLYYPYTPTPNTDYPLDKSEAFGSYDDEVIFSSLIAGWGRTVNAPLTGDADRRDQSQTADFTAADLHIAQLTTDQAYSGGRVSTVGATMKHAMGLAVFNLQQTTVDKKKTYSLSTDANYQFLVKTGTTQIMASGDWTDKAYKPCRLGSTNTYVYWVKPSTSTSVSSYGTDGWSETVSVALNGSQTYDESSSREYVDDGSETYTLAVGDVYFTDGSLGKSGTAYPQDSKTPAGIVFALNADMSTADKTTNGFTHGYVFSLKDANAQGAGHQWYKEASGDVSGIANVTWDATLNMETTENVIKNINGSGQNGYSNTQVVGTANSDYPAFQAVGVYNTTTCPITATQTNSGWYLPSIAEWWLVCRNLGNMNTGYRSNDTGWRDGNNSLWGVYYNNNSANSVHAALNTALSKAGSKGAVYNPIQGGSAADPDASMSAASVVGYWSSSEWSGAGYAFSVGFNVGGNLHFVRYNGKSLAFRVRPVLAF